MLGVIEEPTTVCQGRRIGHVDADSMAMAQWCLRNEFVQRRPSVSVCDDSVKTDLVEIGCLELQHFVDGISVDAIRNLFQSEIGTFSTTEGLADQGLTIGVEKVEGWEMSANGDLDQLREAITDLRDWQSPQEGEVKEGLCWSMIGTKTIFVLRVIDGCLDAHGSINQTDECSRNADEWCVPAIHSAGKSGMTLGISASEHGMRDTRSETLTRQCL